MKNKKILITGANGLLGQKLVKLISEQQGYALIATGRGDNRLPYTAGYVYQSMDITDYDQVNMVMQSYHPDVVIHAAAMTNVDQCESEQEKCWELNVTATHLLIDAAEAIDAFFIHLSTDFIFDGEAGPYTEADEPNPVSFYGQSKLAAEELLYERDKLRWAIARTVLVYGLGYNMSRSNIILWVKQNLSKNKPLRLVTDQVRSPTLAEDLAMGCFLLAQKEMQGIFNISGKDVLTPYDMAMKTAAYFKLDQSLISEADSGNFSQPAKRPPKTGFIIDKARKKLGYDPHSFDEGIDIIARQLEETEKTENQN